MLRISTVQAFNQGVAAMQRNHAGMAHTQAQVDSGKRILTAADDPLAASHLLALAQQQSRLQQYQGNLAEASSRLSQQETILDSVNSRLQHVRELALRAADGALSKAARGDIAAELAECEKELMALMNSQDEQGHYRFGGFACRSAPVVQEADGSYRWQGDNGSEEVQIADGLTVAMGISGETAFASGQNAARLQASGAAAGWISGALVEDELAFAQFPSGGIRLDFNDPNDPLAYTLTPLPDGEPVQGRLDDKEDRLVQYQGAAFYINGKPEAGSSCTLEAKGDATDKISLLNGIRDLRKTLQSATDSPQGARQVRDAVALGLRNIDSNAEQLDSQRGQIGARLNLIAATQSSHESQILHSQNMQSQLGDLDYFEALSRLTLQSTLLEASQRSFAKVSRLSLFDWL